MRLFVTTFIGVVFGFFLGVTFPTISLTKARGSTFDNEFDIIVFNVPFFF